MTAETFIRFEDPRSDRVSPTIGPCTYVQFTYNVRILVGLPSGEEIEINQVDQEFQYFEQSWSDMIIYGSAQEALLKFQKGTCMW